MRHRITPKIVISFLVTVSCLAAASAQKLEHGQPFVRLAARIDVPARFYSKLGFRRAEAIRVDAAFFSFDKPHNDSGIPMAVNIFPDVAFNVAWATPFNDAYGNFIWRGQMQNERFGGATLVISESGALVTGHFTRGDGWSYEVATLEDGSQWVLEIDERAFPDDEPGKPPVAEPADARIADPAARRDAAAADDPTVIDVMVAYTPKARQTVGSTALMRQLITLGVTETNDGYSNSSVDARIRLVHSVEVNYTESGDLNTDLSRLRRSDDGYMDEIHRLRTSYGADLVSLWVESGDACGLGYILSSPSRPSPDYGFSVVVRNNCAVPNQSFAHELGHNLGATHARDDDDTNGAYSYSHGFKQLTGSKFRTIMAYDKNCSCPRIRYYSNPNVRYNGAATGISTGASNSAANALTINNTWRTVTDYRDSVAGGGGSGGSGSSDLPESAHPYSNNFDRTWTSSIASATALSVTFDSRTSVEPGYDFIHVMDGNDGGITGSPFTGTALAGRTVTVTGSTVKVRFVTDDSDVDWGFRVTSITRADGGGGSRNLPKLVVTSFTAPTSATVGSTFAMRMTVQNTGTASAGAFRVGFYFGRTRNVTTSDIYSGWRCTVTNGLAAAASYTCAGDIGMPSSLEPGTWYLAAIADDQAVIEQSDRSGNVRVADTGALTLSGGSPAEITTPVPGSTLTSGSVVFEWSRGSGVTEYLLSVGTSTGGTTIYNRSLGTALTATVSGLPTNGSSIYVRLSSRIGSTTRSLDYVYRSIDLGTTGNLPKLVITSFTAPTSGTIGVNLTNIEVVVSNQGRGNAAAFRIGYYYGRTVNVTKSDVYSGWFCNVLDGLSAGASFRCSGEVGVPSTLASGTWYLAAIADDQDRLQQSDLSGRTRGSDRGPITITGLVGAEITGPVSGSTLTSQTVTFRWNAVAGAAEYRLRIGSTRDGNDFYDQELGTNTSATASNLPNTGVTVYARLDTRFGSDWLSTYATYRASNAAAGMPRLVVSTFTAPRTATAGVNLDSMSVSVQNAGNTNAPTFRIGFYYGRTASVSTNDVDSGWSCTAQNGLAAGATFTCSGNIGVPGTLSAGTWYLAAIADDQFVVRQSDRAGNVRVADTGPLTVRASGEISLFVPELGGVQTSVPGSGASAVTVGYARMQATGATTPYGIAMFSYRQQNVVVSETAVPAAALIRSGRLYAESGGGVRTGVALVNPNNQAVTLTFFTNNGTTDQPRGTVTIPANGHIASFLDQAPFNGATNFTGTFNFSASAPVAAIALRGFTNERSDFLMTTLPVIDTDAAAPSREIYISHFVDGGGWRTQLILVNPTETTINGTAYWTDQAGAAIALGITGPFCPGSDCGITRTIDYTLSAHMSLYVRTSGASSITQAGRIRVVPRSGTATPVALGVFAFKRSGITVSESGILGIPLGTDFRMYGELSGDLGRPGSVQTGVAITAGPDGANVQMSMSTLDGADTGWRANLSLPPNGQIASFLNELGSTTLRAPVKGLVSISSTGSIAVAGLRGRFNERGDFLIATTPPVSSSGRAAGSSLVFPHLATGGGYVTEVVVFSGSRGQSGSITLSYHNQTGQALDAPPAEIPPVVGVALTQCDQCG